MTFHNHRWTQILNDNQWQGTPNTETYLTTCCKLKALIKAAH